MDYIISSESTMDINIDYLDELEVSAINSNYQIDGKIFLDDFAQTLDMKSFYTKMQKGAMTSTSAINIEEYLTYFRPILEEGHDIIHICLSSGISVQFNFLEEAVEILKKEFPDRKIYPVDSLMASSGIALLVSKLVDLKNKGMDIDSLYKRVMENKRNVIGLVTNEDLRYLARGGRISKTAANLGGILHINPLITVDDNGKLQVISKIRTRKKYLKTLINKIESNSIDGDNYSDNIFISHANNEKFAIEVKSLIEDKFKNAKINIFSMGPTIGSHIGPGALAVFHRGKKRQG
ncbi:MAG: DegV family protein [Anaerococcus sp.]|nr:DegV family protein [Anaerococcus sp.]